MTDLGRLERGIGLRPQPGSLPQGTITSPVFNSRRGPSFLLHLRVESGSRRPSQGGPRAEARLCWEEGRAPASGNENQQARECGPVCAPDTKRAEVGRGAREVLSLPVPCLSPSPQLGSPARTLRIPPNPEWPLPESGHLRREASE